MMLPVLVIGLIMTSAILVSSQKVVPHEYCIIGAGPGGLQMGYFLESAGHEYVIFEKNSRPGSFYIRYPRHRTLISINKRFTGKTNYEFNLRHDWNSLISDNSDLLFTKYSSELFPPADDYLRYLSDFHTKLGLNIQFNTTISDVSKRNDTDDTFSQTSLRDDMFTMRDQHGTKYNCRHLIIATGIGKPNIPNFPGINYTEGYETVSINPKDFEGQTVLILGRGNSAFETAQGIYGATNHIHMIGRSRVRLSWSTHYVGDLRAVNNALLDTYQLKSLDAVLEAQIGKEVGIEKRDGRLYIAPDFGEDGGDSFQSFDNFAMREPYDRVIRCLGFKFDHDLFHPSTGYKEATKGRVSKYPPIKHSYESQDVEGLYFAGTNTHMLDFRKSAGGFIHGFRYTARALHHHLEWRNHGVKWPSKTLPITELLNTILMRINEASGSYQMFSVLGDVILLKDEGRSFVYLEEFPIQMLHKLTEMSGYETGRMIAWNYEYGKDFSGPGKDVFRADRAVGEPTYAHQSNFLHPVFYYYTTPPNEEQMLSKPKKSILPRPDRIHHIIEDFLTAWDGQLSHIMPLRRYLDDCLGFIITEPFFDTECFSQAVTNTELSPSCQVHFMQNFGLSSNPVAEAHSTMSMQH